MRSALYLFPSRRAQRKHRVTTLRDLVLQVLVAFVALICPFSFAGAAQEAVWQLGKFDQSSAEFHQGEMKAPVVAGAQPESEVLYIIGKSNPANDWPAFQPGSSNGGAGFRPHPYMIQFDLPGAPQGLYTLKVALLVETPRVSRLQVEINGHRALLFQHPTLNYAGGDVSSVFEPAYSADTITVDLPTDYLKEGANELVLTAMDEPSERDDVTKPGIFYDALELDQDPDGKFPSEDVTVKAQPTVFYRAE